MMVSLMEDIEIIFIVFLDKGICLSSPVPISLPSWSMTDMVMVKPHIPGNKKELSQYQSQPSLTGLLTPKRLKISVLNLTYTPERNYHKYFEEGYSADNTGRGRNSSRRSFF
jgi:hypothetical protein